MGGGREWDLFSAGKINTTTLFISVLVNLALVGQTMLISGVLFDFPG